MTTGQVRCQISSAIDTLTTLPAVVRELSGMSLDVPLQVVGIAEPLMTQWAVAVHWLVSVVTVARTGQ